MDYVWDLLLAFDRLANAVLLGSPDETISSRMGRWSARQDRGFKRRVGMLVCGVLDAVDPGHCVRSRGVLVRSPVAQSMPYRRF